MEIFTTILNAMSSNILLYVAAFTMGRGVINTIGVAVEPELRNKTSMVGMCQMIGLFLGILPAVLLSNNNMPIGLFLYSLLAIFLSVLSLDYQQKEKKSFLTGWRNTKYAIWSWFKGMKRKQKIILGLYAIPPIPLGIALSMAKTTPTWVEGLTIGGIFAMMPPVVLFLVQYLDEMYTRNKEINFFEQSPPDILEKMATVENANINKEQVQPEKEMNT